MRHLTWKSAAVACALMLIAATAPAARAGLLPVSVSVAADGENYRYTYGVVLTSDTVLKAGDYFTIYDFAGMIPKSALSPGGFTFKSMAVGPTPNNVTPTDSPSIPNATWTYNGPTLTGPVGLGDFSVDSTIKTMSDGFFTSRSHRVVDCRVEGNVTSTSVPVPEVPGVPEPASFVLLGAGLCLALAFRGLRAVQA